MDKLEKDRAILSETEAQEFVTFLEGVKGLRGEGFFYLNCQTWIRRFSKNVILSEKNQRELVQFMKDAIRDATVLELPGYTRWLNKFNFVITSKRNTVRSSAKAVTEKELMCELFELNDAVCENFYADGTSKKKLKTKGPDR